MYAVVKECVFTVWSFMHKTASNGANKTKESKIKKRKEAEQINRKNDPRMYLQIINKTT